MFPEKDKIQKALVVLGLMISGMSVAHASEVNPKVVLAIAKDIDALLGDTVDEGEWDASVKRDLNNLPVESSCEVKDTYRGPLYICSFSFVVTPYSTDTNEGKPWEALCSGLLYFSKESGNKVEVENYKDSIQSCLETLNEGP